MNPVELSALFCLIKNKNTNRKLKKKTIIQEEQSMNPGHYNCQSDIKVYEGQT